MTDELVPEPRRDEPFLSADVLNLLIGVALGGLAMAVILLGIELTSPNGTGLIGLVTGKANQTEGAEKALKEKDEKIEAGERAISERENKLKAAEQAVKELESKLKMAEQTANERDEKLKVAEQTAKQLENKLKSEQPTKELENKLKTANQALLVIYDKLKAEQVAREKAEKELKTARDQLKPSGDGIPTIPGPQSPGPGTTPPRITVIRVAKADSEAESTHAFEKNVLAVEKLYPPASSGVTLVAGANNQAYKLESNTAGTIGRVDFNNKSLRLTPGSGSNGFLHRIQAGVLQVRLEGGEMQYITFMPETLPSMASVNCVRSKYDFRKEQYLWALTLSLNTIKNHHQEIKALYPGKGFWDDLDPVDMVSTNTPPKTLFFSKKLRVKIHHPLKTKSGTYDFVREDSTDKVSTRYVAKGVEPMHFIFAGNKVCAMIELLKPDVRTAELLTAEILAGQLVCPIKVEKEVVELPVAHIDNPIVAPGDGIR